MIEASLARYVALGACKKEVYMLSILFESASFVDVVVADCTPTGGGDVV